MATALNRIVPFRPQQTTLNMVFLAITKKCPLACEHCFEWEALNQKRKLTLPDLHALVRTFQDQGDTQIFFSGGEPMLRVHDLLEVLPAARPGTDFWVITSGFNFTRQNAEKLKHACPFCQKKSGSALTDAFNDAPAAVRTNGCQLYHPSSI